MRANRYENLYQFGGAIIRIYISGPYGLRANKPPGEILKNLINAMAFGVAVAQKGHSPFIPHLYHFPNEIMGRIVSEERWLEICMDWILPCDGMLMLPDWLNSEGAIKELHFAIDHGRKIFYSLQEVPNEDTST